jgi:phytol kinase
MLSSSFLALAVTFALSLVWLRINNFAAQQGWVTSDLSRKIIHIGTGPLFVLCWLLFPAVPSARYLAALVPAAITGQFILVGTGLVRDPAAVRAMSRSGDRREILRGPLLYGLIFVALTLIYWQDTPIGITALMLLCGGDGLADILGRRFGSLKLPWNQGKSWIGMLGMFCGGLACAAAILAVFLIAGVFAGSLGSYFISLIAIAFVSTLVETLPFKDIDNLTITLTAVAMGHLLF